MNAIHKMTNQSLRLSGPTFGEAFRFWLKLGFISFGGPTGQIAIMQTELVEKKKWISQSRFLHALNFCMLLPGPEAQQLAIYIGWLLHKIRGGIVAGAFFVIPSIFVLWTLELHLRRVRKSAVDCRDLLRTETGRDRDRARRCHSHRSQSAEERSRCGRSPSSRSSRFTFFKVPFPAIVLGAGVDRLSWRPFWKSEV